MADRSADPTENDVRWALLLKPGVGLKRWLTIALAGVLLSALGLAVVLVSLLQNQQLAPLLHWLTLRFLPDWTRVPLFVGVGIALTLVGLLQFQKAIFSRLWPDLPSLQSTEVMIALLRRQRRRQGPKVVAIGGGTGLPQLLRGLRQYTDEITAIVTVADDGGSSGRLRRQTGMLPPGDFRNNIAALSEAEGLMKLLFQYRFGNGAVEDANEGESGHSHELAGHSFGNLFITTMAAITGSFETALAESSKVLAVRGRVLPSTLENVVLCAEVRRTQPDGSEAWVHIEGESKLPGAGGQIERVYLQPEHARGYPEAIRAILQADLIVAGPGSFFTSVMPNLLVQGIRDAISASSAPRIYICNVATQAGETDGYTVSDHMRKLRELAGDAFVTVLANDNYDLERPPSIHSQWVTLPPPDQPLPYRLYTGDVIDEKRPWRHDSAKLAAHLMEIYEKTGVLSPES